MTMPKGEGKLIAQNKKARHDYHILETFEAGMVLQGTEIKSIRPLKIYIKDGYAKVLNGLAKGKKEYDKRESIKQKDQERQIRRIVKNIR